MIDLQHTFDLTFGDQRHPGVTCESFGGKSYRHGYIFIVQIRYLQNNLFGCDPPRQRLA